jgi:O-antigen ligase
VADRYGEAIDILWGSKLGAGAAALAEGDLDAFSSGRITLYRYAIKDILIDPIFGNGFHGFFLHISPGEHAEAIAGNNSPHNQFLTAVWKMGLLAGFFYLLFLYECMKNLYLLRRRCERKAIFTGLWILMVVYLVVFCSFWDVLLVPLIGMFLMFLLGGTSRIIARERRLELLH